MSEPDLQPLFDSLPGYPPPAMAGTVHGHGDNEVFLARAYKSGKLHHALIFNGRQGIGKSAFAFQLARHIISNPDPSKAPERFAADNGSSLARQLATGAHPQVLHLTRPLDQKTGKFRTQLTTEETKRIGRFLTRTVADNGYRVVIVDSVNDMNTSASNALLKNLEEPTPRTLFVLISHASGRLLPTIRSRCLVVPFQPLAADAMDAALSDLGIAGRFSSADYRTLLTLSEGSPRLAAMLADAGGLEIMKAVESVISQKQYDLSAAMKIGEALAGRDSEMLFDLVAEQLMNALAAQAKTAVSNSVAQSIQHAQLHQHLTGKIAETVRYNLDRKQLVASILQQLHTVGNSAAAG